MKALVLLTDAFGRHGGIAKFNRDLLRALSTYPQMQRVLALPRILGPFSERLPENLDFRASAAQGKASFTAELFRSRRFAPDIIICGHIHLLPFAFAYQLISRGQIVLIIHGIDAWRPTQRMAVKYLVKRLSRFISVSELTRRRFCAWSGISEACGTILPNCVEAHRFGPGVPCEKLVERYRLKDRKVILTLGRLAATERYKGFDEVLEIMPALMTEVPNITYILAGDGADGPRLVAKAQALGLQVLEIWNGKPAALSSDSRKPPQVVFTGRVSEDEKADHFRLADAYIMPSRCEGFGIVFLEALACGLPVVGSRIDGSSEALKNGVLGDLVDPRDRDGLTAAVLRALRKGRGPVSPQLADFSYDTFEARTHKILEDLTSTVSVQSARTQNSKFSK